MSSKIVFDGKTYNQCNQCLKDIWDVPLTTESMFTPKVEKWIAHQATILGVPHSHVRVATGQGHEFMTKFMAFLVKNSWFFLQNHGIFLKIHVWNFVLDILQPSNNTRPLTKTKRIPEIAYILLRVSSKFQDWRHIHNTRLPYPRPPQTMMIPSLASKLRSISRGLKFLIPRLTYSRQTPTLPHPRGFLQLHPN